MRITPFTWRVSESLLSNGPYMLRHFGYRWIGGSKQHTARCLAIRAAWSAHCTYHDEHYAKKRAYMATVATMFDDWTSSFRDFHGPDLADPREGIFLNEGPTRGVLGPSMHVLSDYVRSYFFDGDAGSKRKCVRRPFGRTDQFPRNPIPGVGKG